RLGQRRDGRDAHVDRVTDLRLELAHRVRAEGDLVRASRSPSLQHDRIDTSPDLAVGGGVEGNVAGREGWRVDLRNRRDPLILADGVDVVGGVTIVGVRRYA